MVYWIGMTDLNTEGAFTWESGHKLTSDVSAHWYPGEPNNSGNEDCVTVGHADGRMNDLKCSEKVKFVCQKRDRGEESGTIRPIRLIVKD